jgi:hypothetical protein
MRQMVSIFAQKADELRGYRHQPMHLEMLKVRQVEISDKYGLGEVLKSIVVASSVPNLERL